MIKSSLINALSKYRKKSNLIFFHLILQILLSVKIPSDDCLVSPRPKATISHWLKKEYGKSATNYLIFFDAANKKKINSAALHNFGFKISASQPLEF